MGQAAASMTAENDDRDIVMARVACQEARAQRHRDYAERHLASAIDHLKSAQQLFQFALHEEGLYRREILLAVAEGEGSGIAPELPPMPEHWIRESIDADALFGAVIAWRDPRRAT